MDDAGVGRRRDPVRLRADHEPSHELPVLEIEDVDVIAFRTRIEAFENHGHDAAAR